jgi:hypothetical protein
LTGWTFCLGPTDWDPVFVEPAIVEPGAVKL